MGISWAKSLVGVGWIALEAINRAGFGGSECEPFLGGVLQVDEELFAAAARKEVQVLAFIDFDLICELANELFLVAAGAPDSDVGFGFDALAEFQHGYVFQDFFDGRGVDQSNAVGLPNLEDFERGQHAQERGPGGAIGLMDGTLRKLDIVREKQAVAAYLVLKRERL